MLRILSKIFEKNVCEHLQSEFHTPSTTITGFRKFHSTETALVRLVDQLLMDLDNNRESGLNFVDYKKAFTLFIHQLLVQKLNIYGVQRNKLKLFRNFISDRFQYVDINGNRSSSQRVISGVPQGSTVGPILFLLFINDLLSKIQCSVLDIYADDTTVS